MLEELGSLRWATDASQGNDTYEDWVEELNRTFGIWHAAANTQDAFKAEIEASFMPSMALIDCRCDPCGGSRANRDVQDIESEQLTMQLVISGKEHMRLGDQEAMLSPGDIFVWDNTQSMRFEVLEPLHKLSLVLPLQRLKDWVPSDWRTLPRHLRSGDPMTSMLAGYMRSISAINHAENPMRWNALVEAAVAMLVAPHAPRPGERSQRLAQLEIVRARIDRSLRDPDLTLEKIAASCRISLRYLHWLFEGDEDTPWRYIVRRRLDGCRKDLANPAFSARTVTDIAFSWGFSNVAHFGRRFKAFYGKTPSESRSTVS